MGKTTKDQGVAPKASTADLKPVLQRSYVHKHSAPHPQQVQHAHHKVNSIPQIIVNVELEEAKTDKLGLQANYNPMHVGVSHYIQNSRPRSRGKKLGGFTPDLNHKDHSFATHDPSLKPIHEVLRVAEYETANPGVLPVLEKHARRMTEVSTEAGSISKAAYRWRTNPQ